MSNSLSFSIETGSTYAMVVARPAGVTVLRITVSGKTVLEMLQPVDDLVQLLSSFARDGSGLYERDELSLNWNRSFESTVEITCADPQGVRSFQLGSKDCARLLSFLEFCDASNVVELLRPI
jgi:hypothetical protein